MVGFRLAGLALLAISMSVSGVPAQAGDSGASHGVRVHKLMRSTPARTDTQQPAIQSHTTFAPHGHRIVLKKGTQVIVRFADGIGRSRYRRRHPGVARPWQDRRFGRKRRPFMNPKGLYTSKIYRRGYY